MTIFEKVKQMTKEEFSAWCGKLYYKAWCDGRREIDDEHWIRNQMADINADVWEEELHRA